MALPLRAALRSAGRFMVKNPTTMLSMARHALGMRIAVPLDSLRWFLANTPPSKKAPQDITITPRPPAIGLGATIDLMGTTVRAGASIRIEKIEVSDHAFKVTLRLSDVTMKVLGESFTPVAGEPDLIANLANITAALRVCLPVASWIGFYIHRAGELVLGPFQGNVACVRIAIGRGVCGTAAAERRTVIVPDVDQFPGHIA